MPILFLKGNALDGHYLTLGEEVELPSILTNFWDNYFWNKNSFDNLQPTILKTLKLFGSALNQFGNIQLFF